MFLPFSPSPAVTDQQSAPASGIKKKNTAGEQCWGPIKVCNDIFWFPDIALLLLLLLILKTNVEYENRNIIYLF